MTDFEWAGPWSKYEGEAEERLVSMYTTTDAKFEPMDAKVEPENQNANDENEKNIISNFDDISRSPSNLNDENKKTRRGSSSGGGLVRSGSSGGLVRNNSSCSLNDLQEGRRLEVVSFLGRSVVQPQFSLAHPFQ